MHLADTFRHILEIANAEAEDGMWLSSAAASCSVRRKAARHASLSCNEILAKEMTQKGACRVHAGCMQGACRVHAGCMQGAV